MSQTIAPAPFYSDDAVELYCGDCRDLQASVDRVDAIITDPPYSSYVVERSRRGAGRGEVSSAREFGFAGLDMAMLSWLAGQFRRLARRWVLVFSDIEICHEWRVALCSGEDGLRYVRTGYWVKGGTAPQFSGDRPAAGVEPITICHAPAGRLRWNGGGRPGVWYADVVKGQARVHPAQKPRRLLLDLIADFTNPGDVVLDPFAGSGSALLAAKALGRRAVGFEIEDKYCRDAAVRLKQEALFRPDEVRRPRQDGLFAGRPGLEGRGRAAER